MNRANDIQALEDIIMKYQITGLSGMKRQMLSATVWIAGSMLAASAVFGNESSPPVAQAPLSERLQKKISVDFRKTPMEDVIRIIAEQADVDMVASPRVQGEVTVKLTDVTLEEALRSILDVHGCDYVVGNNIVRVLAREEMPQVSEKQITEIFEITYADVAEVVKSFEKSKSESGTISFIQGTSHILVTDKESRVKAMGDFIRQVDRITPQVLVEARIYDITSKDRYDLGVQWSAGTRTLYDASGKPDISTETEPFANAGFEGTISKTETTTAGVRFGWLNSDIDLDVLLSAEKENIGAKLLANPRILVLDNETASIKIVSEIPYQELQESALGGAIGTTAFREVGVELRVSAHVAARDNMVRLRLEPVFSVVTGEVQVAGIGVTYPQPVVDRREADTTLIVANGQTVVLGGLRKKEVAKQINKVPLLGDLPLAGALFRFKGEDTVNSELLVFITPWIVEQPRLSAEEEQAFGETDFPAPQPVYTEAERTQD